MSKQEMKSIKATLKLLSIFLLPIILFSCSDNSDLELDGTTKIMIVNASPDAGPIEFYLDDIRVDTAGAISYTNNSGYIATKAGDQKADVKVSLTSELLLTQQVFFQPNRTYSLFVTGKAAKDSVIYVATEDKLIAPTGNKAKIRFINLSPGTIAYDVFAVGKNLFSNATYRSASEFQEVNAASYILELRASGTTANVLSRTINVEAGRIYTIWLKGLSGIVAGDTALGIELLRNN